MDRDDITTLVARLARQKPAAVTARTTLGGLGLSSSFGLTSLRSRIEAATGRILPIIEANTTMERLFELALDPTAVSPSTPGQGETPPTAILSAKSSGLSLEVLGMGLDMQEIAVLPDVTDYRNDPFYSGNFQASEISTALLKPNPRAHLCGLFCAKEAAKKTHPLLLDLRMSEIAISHEANGQPKLQLVDPALNARLGFLISITHTEQHAAASCLAYGR